MIFLVIFLSGILIALGTGLLSAYSDLKGMTIPNLYSVIVLAAFALTYFCLWLGGHEDVFFSLVNHVVAAFVVFGVTAGMYALKALGAADSKLASAFALWVGVKGLFPFLFYTTLLGGLLALVAVILRGKTVFKNAPPESWIGRVQAGESKVPYGVAIVAGALASFVDLGYIDLSTFAMFVGH